MVYNIQRRDISDRKGDEEMQRGVELLIEPGTSVRRLLRRNPSTCAHLRHCVLEKRMVRSLRLISGEATFLPCGSVQVKMPGANGFVRAFGPLEVLGIYNLKGQLRVRNRHMCVDCVALTGRRHVNAFRPVRGGVEESIFKCERCDAQWQAAMSAN